MIETLYLVIPKSQAHGDRGAQGRNLLFRRESAHHGEDLRAISASLRPE